MEENASSGEYVGEDYFDGGQKLGIKGRLEAFLESRYFLAIVVVFVAITSFFLGKISGLEEKRQPVKVYGSAAQSNFSVDSSAPVSARGVYTEVVVASKNGTKYHYPWCSGAKQISEQNKITFNSTEEARKAGYTPASNCKGLK